MWTALHMAAVNNHINVVEILIKRGSLHTFAVQSVIDGICQGQTWTFAQMMASTLCSFCKWSSVNCSASSRCGPQVGCRRALWAAQIDKLLLVVGSNPEDTTTATKESGEQVTAEQKDLGEEEDENLTELLKTARSQQVEGDRLLKQASRQEDESRRYVSAVQSSKTANNTTGSRSGGSGRGRGRGRGRLRGRGRKGADARGARRAEGRRGTRRQPAPSAVPLQRAASTHGASRGSRPMRVSSPETHFGSEDSVRGVPSRRTERVGFIALDSGVVALNPKNRIPDRCHSPRE